MLNLNIIRPKRRSKTSIDFYIERNDKEIELVINSAVPEELIHGSGVMSDIELEVLVNGKEWDGQLTEDEDLNAREKLVEQAGEEARDAYDSRGDYE